MADMLAGHQSRAIGVVMGSARVVRIATVGLALVAALSACSSSKKSDGATSTAGTTAGTSAAASTSASSSSSGEAGNLAKLFATDADLCKVIDVGELSMGSGFIFAPGVRVGNACSYTTSDGKTGLIVSVEKDLPDLVLDSKLKLNGVGNVTVKEVTVKGAKRAILQTQPLPSQVNQTLIARYDEGGVQVLLHSPTLTDQQAINSIDAITGEG
jgi:hypothetical protein